MNTGWELVIIWEHPEGEKVIYVYDKKEDAECAERGMRTALGNQIAWSCVMPKLF